MHNYICHVLIYLDLENLNQRVCINISYRECICYANACEYGVPESYVGILLLLDSPIFVLYSFILVLYFVPKWVVANNASDTKSYTKKGEVDVIVSLETCPS